MSRGVSDGRGWYASRRAATRTILTQRPDTQRRCGCGAVFNAADQLTACPACGAALGGEPPAIGPAAAHLPALLPAPAPPPEPPALRMLSCGRCGAMMDYNPPADGSRARCPSCGLEP